MQTNTLTLSGPAPSREPRLRPGAPSASPAALYLVGERERSNRRPPAGSDQGAMVCLNGRWTALRSTLLTFQQVVDLFQDPARGPLTGATISYRRGCRARPSGLLGPGDEVPLTDGMVINAAVTQAS